ncbi:glycosyltransferase family 4 protein [Histidinibacterium lentulum]|uniref:Glycosyltransferase n=1 Tax=Histidinibacterium lentulum TaxID=2480588 RepID=A0A3N2R6V1_9RHOB|nr:glycosyltransferase family 4 protein [Histidinibacterium lentulum]ROU03222.1 glycosyltransferase [Histidinibacterium lentulum]
MLRQNPAIVFHADAVESEGKDLVGRRAAGESFLRGWLRHAPGDEVAVVAQTREGLRLFRERMAALGHDHAVRDWTLRGDDFTEAGTLFFPSPGYLDAAWRRQRFGPERCSLVGITHTMSTRRAIEGLHRLLSEPVESWDAIICTSRAVRSVVQRQFELEAEYFRTRFGAARVPMPELPLIPLGINAADFRRDGRDREEMRARNGAPEGAFVVLTVGRLTMVEKANMIPLFQVLQSLTGRIGRPVHLWMSGWASRDPERELHERGAREIAPDVVTRMLDGRDPEVRRRVWSGADVFTLPVDSIQETFGLVPVEAMAAGLPVVMPDWNGFRDTVLHGETGFLIPTRTAPPGAVAQIARRFANGTDDYLRHLAIVQQQTAIDLPAYLAAFVDLAGDPALGRRMGEAGARHVRERFDWSAVVPQYLALADHLSERRKGVKPTTPRRASGPPNPLEVDPFDLYRHYPTAPLGQTDHVRRGEPMTSERLAMLDSVNGRDLYRRKVLNRAQLMSLLAAVPEEGGTPKEISRGAGLPLAHVLAGLLFLAKHGAVRLDPREPTA